MFNKILKRYLPKSLLYRSLLIVVTPLVLLQIVSALLFWESHWDKVSLRLARGLAGDVATVLDYIRDHPEPKDRDWMISQALWHMDMKVRLIEGEILPNKEAEIDSLMEEVLLRALRDHVSKPFHIDADSVEGRVMIHVQLTDGVLHFDLPRKRLFSSTAYVFVLWTVGISLVLFGVATVFMRNQVRPIRRLAIAADNFGKGRDVPNFKPEGATEVRQAATAFMAMRDRIQRQINQRTEMLAGVSHDLRTPLTRMKLQLAMSPDSEDTRALKQDVEEMEHMLEGYLAFARGEGDEKPKPTDLTLLVKNIVNQSRRKGAAIDCHLEEDLTLPLRADAFRRCVTNLVENATRYGDHVSVRLGVRDDAVEIIIDDDGPGIPEDKREDVFKPFFRLDQSRNVETGGVGLGLSIARDVIRKHGGELLLSDSPNGGLRARLRLPL